jgi:hypothetical protein
MALPSPLRLPVSVRARRALALLDPPLRAAPNPSPKGQGKLKESLEENNAKKNVQLSQYLESGRGKQKQPGATRWGNHRKD